MAKATSSRRPVQRAGADTRSRRPGGEVRRQRILDAAVELFGSKGYRGTGLAALAQRVDMTATGLLYYFGTKERLLQEVVAERDRVDALPVGEALTFDSLRSLGRHNVETALLTRLYVVLGAESLDEGGPLHGFFVQRYEMGRALVRSIIEAGIADGSVRTDVHVDGVAAEFIAVVMGLEIQWLTDPERVDLPGGVAGYVDRLERQLAPWGS
jgi:AcrR family transcriptional regulator